MRKIKLIKQLCMAVTVSAICCAATGMTGLGATYAAAKTIDNPISIQNIAVTDTSSSLSHFAEIMNCTGKTTVQVGYTAGLTMELQQDNGGWDTIKTWSTSGGRSVGLTKSYAVSSGYRYRLKTTHKAYNSNGSLVESIVRYSNIVWY